MTRSGYVLGKELGAGQYGVVHGATRIGTGKHVAIKSVPKFVDKAIKDARREVQILRKLDHPYVIKLQDTFEDHNALHIVTDMYSGGELFDRILDWHVKDGNHAEAKPFTEKDAAQYAKQLFSALAHCHSRNIAHIDVKPENLLLTASANGQPPNLVLIDFGLSRDVSDGVPLRELCGTPAYIAPEVHMGRYSTAVDVWSAGVVLFLTLSGEYPFHGKDDEETRKIVMSGEYYFDSASWANVSSSCRNLIEQLLVLDPSCRITAEEALQHPWIASGAQARSEPLHAAVSSLRVLNQDKQFKKAVLSVMATILEGNDMDEIHQLFASLDTDGDGFLSSEELRAAIEQSGAPIREGRPYLNAEFIHRLMQDEDPRGISLKEFTAATMQRSMYLKEENLRTVFQHLDRDGSGFLAAWEMAEVFGDSVATAFLQEGDINKDGLIDFEEFCALMSSQQKVMAFSEPTVGSTATSATAKWGALKARRARRKR